MRLTGEVLADLFLSKITKWDDPRLAADNGGLRLPDLAVAPVHRAMRPARHTMSPPT